MRVTFLTTMALGTLLAMPPWIQAQEKTADQEQNDVRRQLASQAELQAERRVAENRINELITSATETSKLLAALKSSAGAFSTRLEQMHSNDDGKKLAANDPAFLHFDALRKSPPPSVDQIDARQKSIDALAAKLTEQRRAAEFGYLPPRSMSDQIEAGRQWAISVTAQIAADTAWLDTVIAQSPKALDLAKRPTLKQRIDAFDAGMIEALAKSEYDARQEALGEGKKKVADAAREASLMRAQEQADRLLRESRDLVERMRIEHEMEIKRLQDAQQQRMDELNKQLAEAKATRLRQEARNDTTVKQAEQDAEMTKKRQKCHDPHVQAVLAPFLDKGYLQPRSGKGIDAIPVSLSELRSAGFLAPDKKGLDAMVKFANNPRNDRSHWGKWRDLRIPGGELEMVKEAQGYLIDLGDALVTEGMLSK